MHSFYVYFNRLNDYLNLSFTFIVFNFPRIHNSELSIKNEYLTYVSPTFVINHVHIYQHFDQREYSSATRAYTLLTVMMDGAHGHQNITHVKPADYEQHQNKF